MKFITRISGIKNNSLRHYRWSFGSHSRLLFSVMFTLFLSACGGGGSGGGGNAVVATPQATSTAGESNDMVIASALYLDERTPDNFYAEAPQDGVFYTINHVKNTSLLPVADRAGLSVHELASNNFVEALDWSEKAAIYQQTYKQLADNAETMLYFQFTRFDPVLPELVNKQRVFKANVLDRSGVDRNQEEARYKGRITMPGVTAVDVKLIIEYLWTFTLSNNYGNAVIESNTSETADEFVHIIKQASLNFSNSDACDSIDVYDIRYTIPKDSGFIWREKVLLRTFFAKRTGAYTEICQ